MRDALLLSLLMAVSMPALAVYKCVLHGHVTYADQPCGPAPLELPAPSPPQDAGSARRQAEAERKQLAVIEKGKEAERVAGLREQQRHKQDRSAIAFREKCLKLELEQKWSAEDAAPGANTVSKNTLALGKAARRKAERYHAQCGAGQ